MTRVPCAGRLWREATDEDILLVTASFHFLVFFAASCRNADHNYSRQASAGYLLKAAVISSTRLGCVTRTTPTNL